MARQARIISEEILSLAAEMYQKGVPVHEILDEFDIPLTRFYSELRKRSIKRPRLGTITLTDDQLAIQLLSNSAEVRDMVKEMIGRADDIEALTDEELVKVISYKPKPVLHRGIDEIALIKLRAYCEVLGWSLKDAAHQLSLPLGTAKGALKDATGGGKIGVRARLRKKAWLVGKAVGGVVGGVLGATAEANSTTVLAALIRTQGVQAACLQAGIELDDVEILFCSVDLDRMRRGTSRKIAAADLERDWSLRKAARRELELRLAGSELDEGDDVVFTSELVVGGLVVGGLAVGDLVGESVGESVGDGFDCGE